MHNSVQRFGELVLTWDTAGHKRILEVGAADVNGSLRAYCSRFQPRESIGIDMLDGAGVDFVCDAEDIPEDPRLDVYDLVICTEMLEHAARWQLALAGVKHAVAPGGHLLLTTRSQGFPRHEHPDDFWRFDRFAIEDAMTGFWTIIIGEDPDMPGVFYFGRRLPDTEIGIPEGVTATPAPTR